jgi:hypothetical protein
LVRLDGNPIPHDVFFTKVITIDEGLSSKVQEPLNRSIL